MPEAETPPRLRLELDLPRYAEIERRVAYDLTNLLLMQNLELQHHFGLRAEDYQVFMLIGLSTVQKFVRSTGTDPGLQDRTPLPSEHASAISRRRISETLRIPLETVRRIVANLLARGMIVERRRGCLSTPGGTLTAMSAKAIPERIARRFVAQSNTLLRLEVIKPSDRCQP